MDHGWSRSLQRSLAVFAGVLGLFGAPAPAGAGAAGLRPTADLGVSAATPTRNLGAARRLVVARAPAQRAFVRFALAAGTPVGTRIVLHLYPLRSSRSGLILRHASERPWDERSITLRSAPRTGPRLVRTGPLIARRWARIDVTALVKNASRVAAFALLPAGPEPAEVASRETGRRTGPRLTLQPA